MKVFKTVQSVFLATVLSTPAIAAPICAEFSSPEAMPKKYAKYAPVLSDGPDGWIIARDQMRQDYTPSEESVFLLGEIAGEFDALGIPLAVMIAPPRPLIAGQETLQSLHAPEEYDVTTIGQTFSSLIETLNSAGILAPDLLKVAASNDNVRRAFYFKRDTHWTPTGAAHSALALADDVAKAHSDVFPQAGTISLADLTLGSEIAEKGSLAGVAKKVCAAALEPEAVPTLVFPSATNDLFADTSDDTPRVALAGSSFSDRYKRDFYRVADSLAGALGAEVDNYSVSGGGPIGGIESLVLSGQLTEGAYDLVVWELPYTEGFQATHFLRQLLGALRYGATDIQGDATDIAANAESVTLPAPAETVRELVVKLPASDVQNISAKLQFKDNKPKTIKLQRRNRVPKEMRSDVWVASLDGLQNDQLTSVTFQFRDGVPGENAQAITLP